MAWLDRLIEKWQQLVQKMRPGFQRVGSVFRSIGSTFATLWRYIFWFRGIIMAAPVAAASAVLAAMNMNRLPETVEITKIALDTKAEDALFGFLVTSTDYVARDVAVYAPLLVTGICLLLMFCSKRKLYPWIISIFTLCLPLVLYLFNTYPM